MSYICGNIIKFTSLTISNDMNEQEIKRGGGENIEFYTTRQY